MPLQLHGGETEVTCCLVVAERARASQATLSNDKAGMKKTDLTKERKQ